ncbi:uromodulin-like isoform X2 [Ostrea edulis]|uniref:uromodulin-like isoform X2 n=1 Tax=Ostrea edulis TaxID=37623 RepID=UPI0024AF5B44|nr:uromodulin-like isoform X2 [Ostrea edulis]
MDLWWIELWCLAQTFFFPVVLSDSCSTYDTMTGDVVRRSSAYILTPTDTAICDSFLDEKWYRLDSLAGNDIVQTCPPVTHCGTLYPLWMNGTLPLVSEGEVDRTVCQSGLAGCCESSLTIQVRNCGTFNVYNLKRTSGCPIAYCFGTQLVNQSEVTQESTEQTTEDGTSGTQLVNQSTVTQESTEQTNEAGTSDYTAAWIVLGIVAISTAIGITFYIWKHKHTKSQVRHRPTSEEETDDSTSVTETEELSSTTFNMDVTEESKAVEKSEPMGMNGKEITRITITDIDATLPYTPVDDIIKPRDRRIAKH